MPSASPSPTLTSRVWEARDVDTVTPVLSSNLPLTTIFTPPASCLEQILFGAEPDRTPLTAFRDYSAVHTQCWPYSYRQLELPPAVGGSRWYSPGVCPKSLTIAHYRLSIGSKGTTTTQAWCCPSGMGFDTAPPNTWCSSFVTTPTSISSNTETVITSNFYAYMWPISVQWVSADLSLFTPKSAPILLASSSSISSSISISTTTNMASQAGNMQTASTSPRNSGLSTGAEAGIGVGVGLAALLLVSVMGWFLIRRRRRHQSWLVTQHPGPRQAPYGSRQPPAASNRNENYKESTGLGIHEVMTPPAELESPSHLHEL